MGIQYIRRFPIQPDRTGDLRAEGGTVPWSVAEEAYKHYVKLYGSGQSLERIAERGGFGWGELVSLLQRRDHHDNWRHETPAKERL